MTGEKRRILCAENNASARNFYKRLFEYFLPTGYNVEFFENGSALERELQKGSSGIALVITDNKMPEVSGLEILERYARTTEFKGVPFVMISNQDLKTRAMNYGAAAFLEKLTRLKDFEHTIEEALKIDKKP